MYWSTSPREPEARERVRTLLREVMTDELAHVGQRRNFLGHLGLRVAHRMVESMYRAFFRDIPETSLLFNIQQMVQDGPGRLSGWLSQSWAEVPEVIGRVTALRFSLIDQSD